MINRRQSEKGQALLLIALAVTGLFALIGLAVDSGMAFADRRQAQNAADAAALFAARVYAESLTLTTGASEAEVRVQAAKNGYSHNGGDTTVSLQTQAAPKKCPDKEDGLDFTVTIHSTIRTAFSPVVGVTEVKNTVAATARGCKSHFAPIFPGNAVVGLNPDPNSQAFDAWGSSDWTISGGGVFSNSGAVGKGTNVVFPDGDCVTSVGSATGFSCPPSQNNGGLLVKYPQDVQKIMPPDPCDGTPGDVGIPAPPSPGKGNTANFNNAVYCVSDLDSFSGVNIVLNNATLYITDPTFDLKFAGKGGFSGTAINGGDFMGYFLVVPLSNAPCPSFTAKNTQVIEFRGNGLADLTGTFLAPSACIDYRGNSNGYNMDSQIVGYNVSSNGTGHVEVNYNADKLHKNPAKPSLALIK
jgi:Flp pilus assembly protein TadG